MTPFGVPVETGRKNHSQNIVRLHAFESQHTRKQSTGYRVSAQGSGELIVDCEFFAEVFQIDNVRIELKVEFLHDFARREYVFDPRYVDALVHDIRRDSVIQIDGNTLVQDHRHVGNHPAHQRRKKQSHMLLVVRQHVLPQQSTQNESSHQRLPSRGVVAQRVG